MKDGAVTLREISADTVRAVCKLAVAPEQQAYVAPNAVSIAQAYFDPAAWFRAVYAGDEPVGFVMLEDSALMREPPAQPHVYLWRFMIDARHQRHGHGRAAIGLVLDHVRARHPALREMLAATVPGPHSPKGFYLKLGFEPTGEWDEGEEVLRLRITR